MGTRATTTVSRARSRNISVVAAMNKRTMLYYKIFTKLINGTCFQECLNKLKTSCLASGIETPVLVLDNARIHHYSELNYDGFRILFLPPYYLFLNIIENCFSKWKNYVNRQMCRDETELMTEIENGFNCITENDRKGYYRNMLRYLNMSARRENIDC